jgi:hypothetical protein
MYSAAVLVMDFMPENVNIASNGKPCLRKTD